MEISTHRVDLQPFNADRQEGGYSADRAALLWSLLGVRVRHGLVALISRAVHVMECNTSRYRIHRSYFQYWNELEVRERQNRMSSFQALRSFPPTKKRHLALTWAGGDENLRRRNAESYPAVALRSTDVRIGVPQTCTRWQQRSK